MENLMNFLEEYWGVTLVGGVSIGSIISFVFVQAKYLVKQKFKDTQIDQLMGTVDKALTAKHEAEMREAQTLAENRYLQKVINTSFKATAYIVAASKLPIEEKLALQEDFTALKNDSLETVKVVAENVKKEVVEVLDNNKESIAETGIEIVTKAADLFSKYSKKEGE